MDDFTSLCAAWQASGRTITEIKSPSGKPLFIVTGKPYAMNKTAAIVYMCQVFTKLMKAKP